MSKLYLMMGQPGSGKSTFIQEYQKQLEGSTLIVSRDKIRFQLVKPEEEYFSREKKVFSTFLKTIRRGLDKYDNVVADATHLTKASRRKVLLYIDEDAYDEVNVIWVKTALPKSLSQNYNRYGTRSFVPESVIEKMFSQIEVPTKDEVDHLFIVEDENVQEVW